MSPSETPWQPDIKMVHTLLLLPGSQNINFVQTLQQGSHWQVVVGNLLITKGNPMRVVQCW
jgi:hypothetical protein